MASVYLRFFDTPPSIEPGTILAMGLCAGKAPESLAVANYLRREGLVVEDLPEEDYVSKDDDGCRISEREVVIRPPLSQEQKTMIGSLATHAIAVKPSAVKVVDFTVDELLLREVTALQPSVT